MAVSRILFILAAVSAIAAQGSSEARGNRQLLQSCSTFAPAVWQFNDQCASVYAYSCWNSGQCVKVGENQVHCGTTWMCTPVQGCNAFSAPRSWDFDDRCGGMYSRACFTAGKCEKVGTYHFHCGTDWQCNGVNSAGGGAESDSGCQDIAPPSSPYSCSQQASFGACGQSWMSGYCLWSCNQCSTAGG